MPGRDGREDHQGSADAVIGQSVIPRVCLGCAAGSASRGAQPSWRRGGTRAQPSCSTWWRRRSARSPRSRSNRTAPTGEHHDSTPSLRPLVVRAPFPLCCRCAGSRWTPSDRMARAQEHSNSDAHTARPAMSAGNTWNLLHVRGRAVMRTSTTRQLHDLLPRSGRQASSTS